MRRRFRTWLAWLLPAVFLLAAAPATAAPHLALVVGNAAYPARPLATASADAGLVAQALAQAGFDVTAAMDLDGKQLRAAFRGFAEQVRAAGPEATIFVYLSGYGVQYDGDNYVVPIDATLAHDDDVPLQAANLEDFARALAAAPATARILVYDLAHANPFAAGDEMPLAPGLMLGTPAADTLVAFDAAPGMVAAPDAPPYGAYARALAEALGTPGLAPARMLERVRLRVGTLTNGAQVPWTEGALDPAATLEPGAAPTGGVSAVDQLSTGALSTDVAYAAVIARDNLINYADFLRAVPDGPLAARTRVLLAVRREATMWRAAANSDDPRAVWTYMRRYPRGPHLFDARRRLAALKVQLEPPPRFDPFVFPGLPAPTDAEHALLAHPETALGSFPPIPVPPAALLPKADPAYGDELPPPAPAPPGVLPIAAALPRAGESNPAQIRQTPPDAASPIVTTTSLAPGGAAALTLADKTGTLVTLATIMGRDGTRTILETGPNNALLSRTTTTQVGEAVTTVQTNGAGGILMKISARSEPDGGRSVRVLDGADALLAEWHRDAGGVVVPGEGAKDAVRAPAAAAVPPAPTSPTVAVPPAQVPPTGAPVPASVKPQPVAAKPPAPAPVLAVPAGPAPAAPPAVAAVTPASPPRLSSDSLVPPAPQAPLPPPLRDAAPHMAAPDRAGAAKTTPPVATPPAAAPPDVTPKDVTPTAAPPLPPPRPTAAKASPAHGKSAPAKRTAAKAQPNKPPPAPAKPKLGPAAKAKSSAKPKAATKPKPSPKPKSSPKASPHRKR